MLNKLVFHHIPKTAGTSLRNIIANNLFDPCQMYWHYSIPIDLKIEIADFFSLIALSENKSLTEIDTLNVKKALRSALSDKNFIGGHLTFVGYKQLMKNIGNIDNAVHVAVLRDPFERLISYWEFCQRQSEHVFKFDGTFQEALESNQTFFRNCTWEQNYYISGSNSFEKSLDILKNNNFILFDVSKLELFAETIRGVFDKENLNILKQDISLKPGIHTKQNVNPNKSYINDYIKYKPLLSDLLEQDQKLFDFLTESGGIINLATR